MKGACRILRDRSAGQFQPETDGLSFVFIASALGSKTYILPSRYGQYKYSTMNIVISLSQPGGLYKYLPRYPWQLEA